jgi:hypothetical protein
MLTFVLFRANTPGEALDYYRRMLSSSLFTHFPVFEKVNMAAMLSGIVVMFVVEWLQKDRMHALQIDGIRPGSLRALIYCALIVVILTFGPTKNADFIYLNF